MVSHLFSCFFFFLNVGEAIGDQLDQENQVPAFKEFGLSELRTATNGFNSELIVSESGEKAPNVVYRGKLRNNRFVAIKRFSKQSWPDPQQFVVIFRNTFFIGYLSISSPDPGQSSICGCSFQC